MKKKKNYEDSPEPKRYYEKNKYAKNREPKQKSRKKVHKKE